MADEKGIPTLARALNELREYMVDAGEMEGAQVVARAEARIERLTKALEHIANGTGRCSECGDFAIGANGGVVGYGCCDSPRATWMPSDPKELANAALARAKMGEG